MNKSKYLLGLFAGMAMVMTSCSADEGTEPGSDSKPVVTLYTYEPSSEYNADNDVMVRFATNNKVEEIYYIAEKDADVKAAIEADGEEAYIQHVISAGTKIAPGEDGYTDVVLTDIYGSYTISAVGVKGNKHHRSTIAFLGLEWEHVVNGTYYFDKFANVTGMEENLTELQICTTDETLYRFKDVYGEGWSLKINLLPDYTGKDTDGTYTFFRIAPQNTPFTYGNYGTVFAQDIGYWQGNSAFVTDNGFESGMYDDYTCFLYLNMSVSAGSLGYGYEYFVPNQQ
ncbi:MAG: hypothetical protein HDS41_04635 [Bacteroides sp.]|nr:hypothetical protein [Bacteroides sp.]